MPYIPLEDRPQYNTEIHSLVKKLNENGWPEGHVNFIIFSIMRQWFLKVKRYHTIARLTGVLENVKQEFYRTHAAPYENQAINKNGNIE